MNSEVKLVLVDVRAVTSYPGALLAGSVSLLRYFFLVSARALSRCVLRTSGEHAVHGPPGADPLR